MSIYDGWCMSSTANPPAHRFIDGSCASCKCKEPTELSPVQKAQATQPGWSSPADWDEMPLLIIRAIDD
jgi:hypothetical protein